jgi:hypothetical protein
LECARLDAALLFIHIDRRRVAGKENQMKRRWGVAVSVAVVSFFLTDAAGAGLFDLFEWNRDQARTKLVLFDVPFFTLMKVDESPADSETVFARAPLFTLFQSRQEAGRLSWTLLDIPFVTVAKIEQGRDRADQRLIDLPIFGPVYRYHRDPVERETRVLFLFRHRTKVASS